MCTIYIKENKVFNKKNFLNIIIYYIITYHICRRYGILTQKSSRGMASLTIKKIGKHIPQNIIVTWKNLLNSELRHTLLLFMEIVVEGPEDERLTRIYSYYTLGDGGLGYRRVLTVLAVRCVHCSCTLMYREGIIKDKSNHIFIATLMECHNIFYLSVKEFSLFCMFLISSL